VSDPLIMLLTPSFPPSAGGIERTAGELAAGLAHDHSVEVVAGAPGSPVGMRPPAGVRVHWAANDPPGGRRATLALQWLSVRVGMELAPDLVLALHIRTMPAARAIARNRGARTALVVHAKEMREQPALARAAVRWADAVVAVSEFSRSLALEAGAEPSRTHIINPGVTPAPLAVRPLRDRPRPPVVVTVARISDRHKGHDVALQAMARLRERVHDVRWTMIGEGALRAELEQAVRDRGLADCVELPGAVADRELHERLGAAHAFCLLSRQPPGRAAGEGFGIASVEAGAHGLPVVAGRVSGVVDAVADGISGLLVDPQDPAAAAAALESVLVDQALAQRLADGGRARAGELAWPVVVDRYRELIGSVCAQPRRGRPSRLGWVRDLATGPQAG
jgi:glycosyltransferase involved in cell wall biosynthesis